MRTRTGWFHLARLAREQDDADRCDVALDRVGDRDQQPVIPVQRM